MRFTPTRALMSLSGRGLVALAIVALAIGVRWNHITAKPLDFHPARQYHSAQIARAYYVDWSGNAAAWKSQVARAYLREDPPIEAPALEALAASAYWVSGGERLWLPRLFSTLFWIAGGCFLFALARRFVPWWCALLALGLYLFLPFPLVASTSFQPDPFMVMLLLAGALALVRHHEQPTRARLVAALALSALAIFAKPVIAAFFLLPLFAALAVVRHGLRGAIARPYVYVFPVLSVIPAAGFYAYSRITGEFLTGRVQGEIAPHLWRKSFYWRGWLDMIEDVLRAPSFGDRSALLLLAIGLLAILLARSRLERALLLALWGGYLLVGLAYTNHISSHNYYSLPLIPVASISTAVSVAALTAGARPVLARRVVQVALVAVAAVAVAVGVWRKADSLHLPRPAAGYAQRVPEWRQIGDLVRHTPAALTLEGVSGLKYDGWIGGRYWPNADDLAWERDRDALRPMNADERFRTTDDRYYPAVGAMKPRPQYFIVTEPMELSRQPDLVVLLSDFQVIAETPDYLIFDLRRKSKTEPQPGERVTTAATAAPARFFYRFPPAWRSIERGMTATQVRRIAGRPARVERRHDLRKPFERWLYGPYEKLAIVFVERRVFFAAMSY